MRYTRFRDCTRIYFAKQQDRMKGKLTIYVMHCNQTFVAVLKLFFDKNINNFSTIITSKSSFLPIFTDRQLRDVIQSDHVDASSKSGNQKSWE